MRLTIDLRYSLLTQHGGGFRWYFVAFQRPRAGHPTGPPERGVRGMLEDSDLISVRCCIRNDSVVQLTASTSCVWSARMRLIGCFPLVLDAPSRCGGVLSIWGCPNY